MGAFRNWRLKKNLIVNIHVLLLFNNDFANLIISSKRLWLPKAINAIDRGEKIGDVAALIIVDQIKSAMIVDDRVAATLREDFGNKRSLNDLRAANQMVVHMIMTAYLMKRDEFSRNSGYHIASYYAQLLTDDSLEQELICNKLFDYARQNRDAFNSRSVKSDVRVQLEDEFSLATKHLEVIDNKLSTFISTEYAQVTLQVKEGFAKKISQLDDSDIVSLARLEIETNAFRQEVQSINNWAWSKAQELCDKDINFLTSVYDSGDKAKAEDVGNRLADLFEFRIERHTQQLINDVATLRNKKLERLKRV